jgi:hypothetical protein
VIRVTVAGVAAVEGMRMTGMIVFMGMGGHPPYSTRSMAEAQLFQCLLRTMTLCFRE